MCLKCRSDLFSVNHHSGQDLKMHHSLHFFKLPLYYLRQPCPSHGGLKYTVRCVDVHISQVMSHPNPLCCKGIILTSGTPVLTHCILSLMQCLSVPYLHKLYISVSASEVFMEKKIFKWTQLKRGNQILIPLHMRAAILERIDHRHRILIKCRERYRDAIWWSNFSQAVKRNVFSLQEAQALWALGASHHSTIGCTPMVKAGKLLWWLKNLSRVQVASVSKVFQFVCNANDVVALRPWQGLTLSVSRRLFYCYFSCVRGQLETFSGTSHMCDWCEYLICP